MFFRPLQEWGQEIVDLQYAAGRIADQTGRFRRFNHFLFKVFNKDTYARFMEGYSLLGPAKEEGTIMKRFQKNERRNEAPPQPVLPKEFARHASELAGLAPDEILKLLQALGRIDDAMTVTLRRGDKKSKVSKTAGGRKGKMSIDDAVEYEKQRIEERSEKEKTVRELFGLQDEEFERNEINDAIYPKRMSPMDITRYVDAAEKRLEDNDRLAERRKKVYSPREEIILNVLTEIKKNEAPRIAQKIAQKQRQTVQGKTLEDLEAERKLRIENIQAEARSATEAAAADEEAKINEKLETARTLASFGKNLRTLTDEAAELTLENPAAAAAVVRQWIGAAGIES